MAKTFTAAVLNLGYAYPWGYAKSWQGVRKIILMKVKSKKATFMNIKTSLNVKKEKNNYNFFIKKAFDVWFVWLISVATLLGVKTMLFQLTKISTKWISCWIWIQRKDEIQMKERYCKEKIFVANKIVWTCVRSLIKIYQD